MINYTKINAMKYQKLNKLGTALLCTMMLISSISYARVDEKTTEKTRDAVENAGPDDWYTLAVSAEKCFKKKVNLKEASEWLDLSLEIAQTPYNLELKGDYYVSNKLPDKAIEYYVRTINTMKEQDKDADVSKVQKKIAKIINFGG
jgi:hypothetical protein